MQPHTDHGATPTRSSRWIARAVAPVTDQAVRSATTSTRDEQLIGAELTFHNAVLGRVEALVRDPVSHRMWRLVTSYGPTRRRVGVPMEWVVKRSGSRLSLAVGAQSLDDLAELAAA